MYWYMYCGCRERAWVVQLSCSPNGRMVVLVMDPSALPDPSALSCIPVHYYDPSVLLCILVHSHCS